MTRWANKGGLLSIGFELLSQGIFYLQNEKHTTKNSR